MNETWGLSSPDGHALALIVKDAEQAVGLGLVELQAARVVDELDVDPVDALALVLLLFVLEDVLVEVVLQVLVGVVDAELLETVPGTHASTTLVPNVLMETCQPRPRSRFQLLCGDIESNGSFKLI